MWLFSPLWWDLTQNSTKRNFAIFVAMIRILSRIVHSNERKSIDNVLEHCCCLQNSWISFQHTVHYMQMLMAHTLHGTHFHISAYFFVRHLFFLHNVWLSCSKTRVFNLWMAVWIIHSEFTFWFETFEW